MAAEAVREADAPADSTEPDTQRHSVLAAIGKLLVEGWRGCLAEQKEANTKGDGDDSG